MVFVHQLRFAHCQSGIETVEVRVRGQDDWVISNNVYRCLSTVMDGSFSHASRTNNLFKFGYVVIVTRMRPLLDAATL